MKLKLGISLLFVLVIGVNQLSPLRASALSTAQKQALAAGIDYFDVDAGGACSDNGDTTLTGGDPEQQTWNFFKSKGVLSDAQIAGVMGNLEQESGFDPEKIQDGGDSKVPVATLGVGWGLAQWTNTTNPNANENPVIGDATLYNITTPIYELATQLNLIWDEMNGHAPNSSEDMIKGLEGISDPAQAAEYFDANFESGSDPGGIRGQYAVHILAKYGGSGADTSTPTPSSSDPSTTSGGCGSSTGSTDCTTATGDAKILCEAEAYKGIYYRYGGGHSSEGTDAAFLAACPSPVGAATAANNLPTGAPPLDGGLSGNPNPCATDCSSLVSVAVDEAFGHNYMWLVADDQMLGTAASDWSSIPIAQAQAGDIVTTDEHVEIVDHVSGGVVYTFGSHQTGLKTGPQHLNVWESAWHWNDPGSGGN